MKIITNKLTTKLFLKTFVLLIAGSLILNTSKAQTNVSGGIYTNTTWTLAGSPYIVTGNVKVFSPAALTIQPGVVVKFDTGTYLTNSGNLYANGTPTDSIIFTSNAANPHAGIYGGVQNATSITYCSFYYADVAMNGMFGGNPIKHCSFTSNHTGINLPYNLIDSCAFRYDTTGISWPGNQSIEYSIFMYNGTGINTAEVPRISKCIFTKNNNGLLSLMMWTSVIDCIIDSNRNIGVQGGPDSITNCEIKHNRIGINSSSGGVFESSDISDNVVGLQFNGPAKVTCNSICHNTLYNAEMEGGCGDFSIANNYWCLNDSARIDSTIYDGRKNISLNLLFFTPFDTVPCNYFCINNYVQDICIVTTDTAINKNKIIWGRNNSPAHGYFNVYDSSGFFGWHLIASVPDTALSQYIDTASHPNLQPYSYRITTVDSCGESAMSPVNTSIWLQVAQLIGKDSLYWTPYIGFAPPHYYIYRGLSLNALTLIDSVTGGSLNYIDNSPPPGSLYLIEAVNPGAPCVATHGPSHPNASYSNGGIPYIPLGLVGMQSFKNSVNISPNPNNGKFNVACHSTTGEKLTIEVSNILGEKVYTATLSNSQGSNQIELQQPGGVYLYKVTTESGSLFGEGKIVLEQ